MEWDIIQANLVGVDIFRRLSGDDKIFWNTSIGDRSVTDNTHDRDGAGLVGGEINDNVYHLALQGPKIGS